MIKTSMANKPPFLNLEPNARQECLGRVKNCDLPSEQKNITYEALLFLEKIEQQLKSPNITIQKMRSLFAFKAELLKKLPLA